MGLEEYGSVDNSDYFDQEISCEQESKTFNQGLTEQVHATRASLEQEITGGLTPEEQKEMGELKELFVNGELHETQTKRYAKLCFLFAQENLGGTGNEALEHMLLAARCDPDRYREASRLRFADQVLLVHFMEATELAKCYKDLGYSPDETFAQVIAVYKRNVDSGTLTLNQSMSYLNFVVDVDKIGAIDEMVELAFYDVKHLNWKARQREEQREAKMENVPYNNQLGSILPNSAYYVALHKLTPVAREKILSIASKELFIQNLDEENMSIWLLLKAVLVANLSKLCGDTATYNQVLGVIDQTTQYEGFSEYSLGLYTNLGLSTEQIHQRLQDIVEQHKLKHETSHAFLRVLTSYGREKDANELRNICHLDEVKDPEEKYFDDLQQTIGIDRRESATDLSYPFIDNEGNKAVVKFIVKGDSAYLYKDAEHYVIVPSGTVTDLNTRDEQSLIQSYINNYESFDAGQEIKDIKALLLKLSLEVKLKGNVGSVNYAVRFQGTHYELYETVSETSVDEFSLAGGVAWNPKDSGYTLMGKIWYRKVNSYGIDDSETLLQDWGYKIRASAIYTNHQFGATYESSGRSTGRLTVDHTRDITPQLQNQLSLNFVQHQFNGFQNAVRYSLAEGQRGERTGLQMMLSFDKQKGRNTNIGIVSNF